MKWCNGRLNGGSSKSWNKNIIYTEPKWSNVHVTSQRVGVRKEKRKEKPCVNCRDRPQFSHLFTKRHLYTVEPRAGRCRARLGHWHPESFSILPGTEHAGSLSLSFSFPPSSSLFVYVVCDQPQFVAHQLWPQRRRLIQTALLVSIYWSVYSRLIY